MIIVEAGILLISLVILSKSASVIIKNAEKLSRFFGISQIAIGFLLISILTTMPELSVSVISSSMNEGAIAAGNVFGSNIANILLILGIGAFLYGLKIGKSELKDIAIILVLTTTISVYVIFNSMVTSRALGLFEGIALLIIFLAYAFYILRKKHIDLNGINPVSKKEALNAFLFFTAAMILVLISSEFVVNSAVKIASSLNLAKSFVGATIIAVGTSLPELSIALQAIRKKRYGLALGDTIGANMTNITLILGIASVINPITVTLPIFIAALLFAIIANIVLFYASAVDKHLDNKGGILFLLIYAAYIITIFYLQLAG